uniref:Uncharacterized protein n=1 Tax=Arundo donax TaxID=35708 RepID=A0A0A9FC87_ARUDO
MPRSLRKACMQMQAHLLAPASSEKPDSSNYEKKTQL